MLENGVQDQSTQTWESETGEKTWLIFINARGGLSRESSQIKAELGLDVKSFPVFRPHTSGSSCM